MVMYEGVRTALKPMVLRRMTKKVHMNIVCPEQPGVYQLEITMVQEGVFWFEKILNNFPYSLTCTVL